MDTVGIIGIAVLSLICFVLLLIILSLSCLKCYLHRNGSTLDDTHPRIGIYSKFSYILQEPLPNLTKNQLLWYPYSQSHESNDNDYKTEHGPMGADFKGYNLEQTMSILDEKQHNLDFETQSTLIVVFSGGAQRIGGFQRYELRRTLANLHKNTQSDSKKDQCNMNFDELYLMDPTGLSWYCYNYDTTNHDGWNHMSNNLLKMINQCKYKNVILIGFCMGATSAMIIVHKMIEKLAKNDNDNCNVCRFIVLSFNPQTDPINHLNGKYKFGCQLLPKEIQSSFLDLVNQCCLQIDSEQNDEISNFYKSNVQLWIHCSDMESELNDAFKLTIATQFVTQVQCPINWDQFNSSNNDGFEGGIKRLIIHKDCNVHALLRFLRDAGELQQLLINRLKSLQLSSVAPKSTQEQRPMQFASHHSDLLIETKIQDEQATDQYYQLSASECD